MRDIRHNSQLLEPYRYKRVIATWRTLKAGMKGLRDIHLTVKGFTIMPVGINIEWFTGIIPTARQFQAVCTNQGLRSSSKGVCKEQERSFAEDR